MRLDIIAQILADAGLGTIGGANPTIFVTRMPSECTIGIMLRSPLDGVPVDANLPNYFHHHIQVVIRHNEQVAGDALAAQVQKTLTFYNRKFLDNDGKLVMQINHLFPVTLPRVYPTLDSLSIEWSMDMNTNYVMPL